MEPSGRIGEHRRSERLEELLAFFEARLGPLESLELDSVEPCGEPVLFIVGCARSGTTLVYQYLAQSGLFTYPSNFVSRFPYSPYLGAKLQEMLVDCDFRGEILGNSSGDPFESSLGKTKGARSPHEFWYFWRRFFPFGEVQRLDDEVLAGVDGPGMMREWRAFQSVEALPLVAKAMIANWHLPYLAGLDPQICFLFVERDAADNAASLLKARREVYGEPRKWYSFKPPGFETVLDSSPEEQVVWQVEATNGAVREGLAEIPEGRSFRVCYEDFCQEPQSLLKALAAMWGREIPESAASLPRRFEPRGVSDSI